MALDLSGLNNLVSTIQGVSNTAQNLVKSVTPIVSVLKPSVPKTTAPVVSTSSSGKPIVSTIGNGTPLVTPNVVNALASQTIPSSNLKWYLIGGGVALVVIAVLIIYLKRK